MPLLIYLSTKLSVSNRLHREMADLAKEELGGMTLVPDEKNLFEWKGTLPGPEGSVYEGGVFHVAISLAHDYPYASRCYLLQFLMPVLQIFSSQSDIQHEVIPTLTIPFIVTIDLILAEYII